MFFFCWVANCSQISFMYKASNIILIYIPPENDFVACFCLKYVFSYDSYSHNRIKYTKKEANLDN